MKIGIISRWNATCGVSMHAEFISNEFIKMGHKVIIFAPHLHTANKWWHHKIIRDNEEKYVVRCYSELEPESFAGGGFEKDVILKADIDFLIVESYASIPYKEVEEIAREISCPKVVVIHEGKKEHIKYNDLRCFDKIVVFDERYIKELLWEYRDLAVIIPYPCHPVVKGNRKFAEDGLKFFSFGRQPKEEYHPYIEALDWLNKKYDFIYYIVRSNGPIDVERSYIKQERRRLVNDEVYMYLHKSDIHLIPKGKTNLVVVSSTLCQCLGALIPTVVPNTRHFETLPENKPVVIYKDVEDLKKKIVDIIENEELRNQLIKMAEKYVEENRSDKIAKKFLKLAKT